MRMAVLVSGGEPGFDGRLYIAASRAWLAGQDPWNTQIQGIKYAAPPPSLLSTAPLVPLPEPVAVGLIMLVGLVGTWWALRQLGLPAWWLLFPPFVDALWNANPQVLLLPLLVAGSRGTAVATVIKIYAAVPALLLGHARGIASATVALLVSAPILPWAIFIRRFQEIASTLATQSSGGMSASTSLLSTMIAIGALLLVGRQRAAWLAVPGLWPSTQWYYASIAVPGLTPIAAALAAVPAQGFMVAALVAAALEVRFLRVQSPPKPEIGLPKGDIRIGSHRASPYPERMPLSSISGKARENHNCYSFFHLRFSLFSFTASMQPSPPAPLPSDGRGEIGYVLNTITATSALRLGSSWTGALASVSSATCWQILKPCWRQNSSKSEMESERT